MKKRTKDICMYILGALVVIGMFTITFLLIKHEIPKDNASVFYMLVGQLAAGFLMVLGYFFGTSKSSDEKTKLLSNNNLIKKD